MNRFQRLSCGFALFAGLVSTSPAAAEGFIDLAVGGAFTGEPFENSVTGGLRGGYWFEGIPFVDLGLALQLTVFSPTL